MATLAMFVALGGTSVAAVQLGRDTVGEEQIINGSITSGDLGTGSVRSIDVRDNTLTHKDVRDGTLRGDDVATNTIGSRNLVDNGIRAEDIGGNSVTGRAVLDESLGGADIADGSVRSEDIANGTITAADLADGVIPHLEAPTADGPAGVPSLRTLGNGPLQAAAGDDPRLTDAREPTGAAGGDLEGTYPNPTLADGSINGTGLFSSSLLDGATGVATLRSLGTGANQAAAGNDPRLSDARTPTGAAGGDLSGTYPNPEIGAGTVGPAEQATLPHARIIATTAQTVPNGGIHNAQFNTAPFLSGMTFNNAIDRLVIGRSGAYMVTAEVVWPQNGTGDRILVVNSSNHGELTSQSAPTTPQTVMGMSAATLARLDAGEQLSVDIAQGSGGDLQTDPSLGRGVALTASWVSP